MGGRHPRLTALVSSRALADYYEAQAKAKGEDEVGGDLRNEALQYTAISFADEKWGSLAKAQIVVFAPLLVAYLVFIEGKSVRKKATWTAAIPALATGASL